MQNDTILWFKMYQDTLMIDIESHTKIVVEKQKQTSLSKIDIYDNEQICKSMQQFLRIREKGNR